MAVTPRPNTAPGPLRMVEALGKEIADYEKQAEKLQKFQEDNSLIEAPTVT